MKIIKHFAACVMFVLLVGAGVFAQTESGRVQGTITDPAGAALPSATVTLTETTTNRVLTAQADDEGNYSFPSLQPGDYRIEIQQQGFSTTAQNFRLEVQQVAQLNFTLQAGEVGAVVEVSGGAPLVETATSAVGETIQGRQIVELPLNGRNVLELARLVPGVTQGVPSGFATGAGGNAETYRGGNTGGAALSVNGQRTQANNFLLDGVDNNESLVNTIQVFPPAEATQEFRVQTSVAPAEFGRGGGAIINTVIRSGREEFFGSAFTFIRNDNLDALPTFRIRQPNLTRKERNRLNEFRRGQYGGSIGGPLYLPRSDAGGAPAFIKDRAFFFADYEGLNQFLPRNREVVTVPTAAFRRGDFSALSTQLIDPLTGNPIPGNRLDLLPGNRLNRVALNYLNAFPLPNLNNNPTNNYETFPVQTVDQDLFDVRIDGNISDANQIFGRVSFARSIQDTTSFFPSLPAGFGTGSNPTRTRSAVIGLTSVLSPSVVNELRVQAARINFGYQPPFADVPVSANLGIPNANRDPLLGGGALIGGFNGQLQYTGDFGPYVVPQNTYQLVDSVGYTTGNHNFRFGGTFLRREVALFRPNRGKGFFFLVGNSDADGIRQTGFEQADLLIGFVNNYQIGPPFGTVGTRNYENAVFAQDDWRVTRNLTLNLGLRYEYFTNPTEQYGRQANFDITTGRIRVAGGPDDALVNQDRNDFSPRIGFAYNIGGDGRTVIRGGYGLFYFLDRGGIDNQLAQNPPYSGFSQFNYSQGFRITLSGQAPLGSNDSRLATLPLPTGAVNNVDLNNPTNVSVLSILPDNRTANVQQFNIQFQRELFGNTALSVGYVGTRGRNLSLYYNLNGTYLNRPANSAFPRLGSVNVRDDEGRSQYDSLQTQLERRFTNGLQFLLAYTFSRTKDNTLGAFDSPALQDISNFDTDFGRSNIDFPHVFTFSNVYDIPFGRGRRFGGDLPRVLDFLIGGFQINSILRLQSGQPFDIRRNNVLVDLVGDPYAGTGGRFLNFDAFREVPNAANGAPARIGSLERNGLRGRPFRSLNLGLAKNFNFTDETRLQLRGEFFNLTNTPQFSNPNTNLDPNNRADFGRIQGVQPFSNRQIQLGLRLEF